MSDNTFGRQQLRQAKQQKLTSEGQYIGVYGSISVWDRSNNRYHFEVLKGSSTRYAHAEENLLTDLAQKFSENGGRLQSAEVTVMLSSSPCRVCTGMLRSWCNSASKYICSDPSKVNFVFRFDHYYLQASDQADAKKIWDKKESARAAYRQLTNESGILVIVEDRQTRRVSRITFVSSGSSLGGVDEVTINPVVMPTRSDGSAFTSAFPTPYESSRQ